MPDDTKVNTDWIEDTRGTYQGWRFWVRSDKPPRQRYIYTEVDVVPTGEDTGFDNATIAWAYRKPEPELLEHGGIEWLRKENAALAAENADLRTEIAPLACIGGDDLHCHHDGCPFEYVMWEAIKKVLSIVDDPYYLESDVDGDCRRGMIGEIQNAVKSFRPKGART